MNLKNITEVILRSYTLSDVIDLDMQKFKRTHKNTFIDRGIPLISIGRITEVRIPPLFSEKSLLVETSGY